MALPECFNERLAEIRGTRQSNCIGTALYLAGLEGKDVSRSGERVLWEKWPFLNESGKLREPEEGALIAWMVSNGDTVEFQHMGIVTGINPLRITHRGGCEDPIYENQTFQEVNSPIYDFPEPPKTDRKYGSRRQVVFYKTR
jgi:hypothetical protein